MGSEGDERNISEIEEEEQENTNRSRAGIVNENTRWGPQNVTKCEKKREQKVCEVEGKLRETICGRVRVHMVENTVIMSLENREGSLVKVKNVNIRQIYNVLDNKINPKDIIEIRFNKRKQKATLELKASAC